MSGDKAGNFLRSSESPWSLLWPCLQLQLFDFHYSMSQSTRTTLSTMLSQVKIILTKMRMGTLFYFLTFPLFPKAIFATSSTFFIFPWQYLLLFIIKNAPCVEAIRTASKIPDVMRKPPCWKANGNDRIPPPTMVDTSVNIDENTVPVLSWSSLWTRLISGLDSVIAGASSSLLSSPWLISKYSLLMEKDYKKCFTCTWLIQFCAN